MSKETQATGMMYGVNVLRQLIMISNRDDQFMVSHMERRWQLVHGPIILLFVVIQPVAEVTSRRRLRSASSSALVVPATRRSSLGDRAFVVAGPRAWNSLPEFVTDCSSPHTFKTYLKTYLFSLSFWARVDCVNCVKCLCSNLGRLRRNNLIKLHYITL